MQQFAKRLLSFILLSVFLTYITPKELFHAFTNHTDSTHEHTSLIAKSGLHISNEHHHCELLKLDQQFASSAIELPYHILENNPVYYVDILGGKSRPNFYQQSFSSRTSRGPPVV